MSEKPKEEKASGYWAASESKQEKPAKEAKSEEKASSFWANDGKRGKAMPLRDVLSVVTGKMCSRSFDDIVAVIQYMSGIRRLNIPAGYPQAMAVCRKEILAQYPAFEPFVPGGPRSEWEPDWTDEWVANREKDFKGSEIKIDKLSTDDADELDKSIEVRDREMHPPERRRRDGAAKVPNFEATT